MAGKKKYSENDKLAQISDIAKAIEVHIEMFGDTDSIEGALTMAVTKALTNQALQKDGRQVRALVEVKFF